MVQSILSSYLSLTIDPLSYYLFQPVLHNWCDKGHGYHSVCGMVHIEYSLLLIYEVVAEWFVSHYLGNLLPYFHCHIAINKMC